MASPFRFALLAALLGSAAMVDAEGDTGLGSPSLSPWYAPGQVTRRDGRWFPGFSEDPQQRGRDRQADHEVDEPLPRRSYPLPHGQPNPGFVIVPRTVYPAPPPARPDPATEVVRPAAREPAWKTRWTPWGYRPNYIGLGGGMGQGLRSRPGQTGIANPTTSAPNPAPP